MRTRCLTLSLLASLAFTAHAGPATAMQLPATPPMLLMAQSGIQDFGAVIDIRRVGAEGAVVLAVTPGGDAEGMGLRPGDRIVSINGQAIPAGSAPAAAMESALASGDGRLRLEVVRDGARVSLQGTSSTEARSAAAGAPAGCGYVSESGAHPRVSELVFPAAVTRIDGRSTPLSRVNRHRVDAGRRVLIVQEAIDGNRFTNFGLQERQRQLRRQGARRYKVLILDVEPNTRYEIGARLLSGPPSLEAIRDNSYWEPVVWRQTAEACR
jgi:hypothetical protein